MKSVPYWLQRADFSSVDHEPADVAGALHAFTAHDWRAEFDLLSEREGAASDYCPPGIGFVDSDGSILHICPGRDGRAMVHYHAETVRKLLGFIPIPRSALHTKQDVETSDVHELIRSFFDRRHDELLRRLVAPHGSRR